MLKSDIFMQKKYLKKEKKIKANYGYTDGSGDYFITIDTDKCNGCNNCVQGCPENVFEIIEDDYDESVAAIKQDIITKIGYICPGYYKKCINEKVNCHVVCLEEAIDHSW